MHRVVCTGSSGYWAPSDALPSSSSSSSSSSVWRLPRSPPQDPQYPDIPQLDGDPDMLPNLSPLGVQDPAFLDALQATFDDALPMAADEDVCGAIGSTLDTDMSLLCDIESQSQVSMMMCDGAAMDFPGAFDAAQCMPMLLQAADEGSPLVDMDSALAPRHERANSVDESRSAETQRLVTAPLAERASAPMPPTAAATAASDTAYVMTWPTRKCRACRNCSTTKTPQWRRGPDGRMSLCNACGLRYIKMCRPRARDPLAASGPNAYSPATTLSPSDSMTSAGSAGTLPVEPAGTASPKYGSHPEPSRGATGAQPKQPAATAAASGPHKAPDAPKRPGPVAAATAKLTGRG